eukprot:jgi/Chlat1/992/Chrsp108S01416
MATAASVLALSLGSSSLSTAADSLRHHRRRRQGQAGPAGSWAAVARGTAAAGRRRAALLVTCGHKVTFISRETKARTVVDVPEDTHILDAAEEAGMELPSCCRGGLCGSCVGYATVGSIDQSDATDIDTVLTPEQIAEGYVLLCQARAMSDCTIETQCDWGVLSLDKWDKH